MNRLNKTESGIFLHCMISLLLEDLFFRIYVWIEWVFKVLPELLFQWPLLNCDTVSSLAGFRCDAKIELGTKYAN